VWETFGACLGYWGGFGAFFRLGRCLGSGGRGKRAGRGGSVRLVKVLVVGFMWGFAVGALLQVGCGSDGV
jgi:hypothetical protein